MPRLAASVAASPVVSSAAFKSPAAAPAGRRGPLSHPAVLLVLATAILFTAYALGYLPQFGSLLEAAVRSGEDSAFPALNPAFYGIAGLIAFLLLLALLRSFDMLLRKFRSSSPLAARPAKPLEQFLEEAAIGKISVRIARESYLLFEPFYPRLMCIDLSDRLQDDLRLSEEEVCGLLSDLLARSDRRDRPSEPEARSISDLLTVFDLLFHVETAAPIRAERPSGSRDRSTDTAIPTSPAPPASSPSAQRKALHAAALRAVESRALRSTQASGLHRRSTDYEGPLRRATDNSADPVVYRGPYRRSTDRLSGLSATSSGSRRTELKPVESAPPDPLFIAPRKKPVEDHAVPNASRSGR